jgi:aspartyl/glutamyl-tRNA(Asn/Gln) amidotransferase C subunit
MANTEKIRQILNAIKLDVKDEQKFEKDIELVLGMFDEIKSVNVDNVSANLNKKRVTIKELRTDEVKPWGFRKELSGKYFKTPNVSKRK